MNNKRRLEISKASFKGDHLIVSFADGRELAVPIKWYPRLELASNEQRSHWRLIGGGTNVNWPDIDEDLSAEGLLEGSPSPRA